LLGGKDLDTWLGGDQQDGFDVELSTFGRPGVIHGIVVGPERGLNFVTNRQGII